MAHTCFVCENSRHECNMCNMRILRYRSPRRVITKTPPSSSVKPASKPSGVRNYAAAVKSANSNPPLVSPSLDHVIAKINLLVDKIKLLKKDITELKERRTEVVTFDD